MIHGDDASTVAHHPQPHANHVDHTPVHTARQIRHELAEISMSSHSSPALGPNAPPPGPVRRLLPYFPWHSLPNYLTYARCLSIPIFLLLSYYPSKFVNRAPTLSVIFALASITDWLDGYLARRWDVTSPFGAFLDPVADKLMVSTALIVLSGRYGGIVAIPSSIIMAREVGVSALREWMAQKGRRESVKVGMQGKVKAALTMVSLSLMLLVPAGVGLDTVGWTGYLCPTLLGSVVGGGGGGGGGAIIGNSGLSWILGPSLIMLFASAVVTVTSGSVYFRAALPVLMGKE
jgi:CDP-diacylglycerol--glycerol-3-phosphate 3-phosphatidyltransferase